MEAISFKIRFDCPVECVDTTCGKVVVIIIAPTEMRLPFLVVSQIHEPQKLRLVPIESITESLRARIKLDMTWLEFTQCPEFIQRKFIRKPLPTTLHGDQDYMLIPAQDVVIQLATPPGTMPLSARARVYARHRNLGEIDELEIEPVTGALVNLFARRRLFRTAKVLAIPGNGIERIEDNIIYTKQSKREIEKSQRAVQY